MQRCGSFKKLRGARFYFFEQIELQAKLLNYFLGSNKSNINQLAASAAIMENTTLVARRRKHFRGFLAIFWLLNSLQKEVF